MSQTYVKECIFCKAMIRMSDQKERKWLPYNEDGKKHECRKNSNGKVVKQDPTSTQTQTQIKTHENHEAKHVHIIKLIQEVLKELEALR